MSQANGGQCARAQYHVMRKASEALPRLPGLIANRLWGIAGVAGPHLDWETADAAATLAGCLGGRVPSPSAGSPTFRAVATVLPGSPPPAGAAIRRFRPALRA